jgi:anti-anti-sigma factor
MTPLELHTRSEGPVAVLAARGELDLAGARALQEALNDIAREPAVDAILLDLSGLEFIDSSGLRAVMLADQRMKAAGRRFALVRGGEPVHRVFDITRMTERLTWVGSAEELARGGRSRG